MKTTIIFSALIVLIIFSYCSNLSSPEEIDRFALYLLKNGSLTTKDVEEAKLYKLKLKDKPVISFNDLVGYQIENHKVYLNEKLSYYLDTDSLEIFSQSFGNPFVLIADGERIYLGSFVTGLSSWVPNTPKIVDYAVNNTEKSFIISGAPYYNQSSFFDVRNDNRIFQALGDKLIQ
jgi:hypothetical protein